MKIINLPCFEISVMIDDDGCKSISSILMKEDVNGDADYKYDCSIEAMLLMILNCADNGIDIETPAFINVIQKTVEMICNEAILF